MLAAPLFATMPDKTLPPVFIVSNFHPASSGWLANWSAERNYCANTYLTHLDRVNSDPNYAFVLSEVNNLIAIHNFTPARFAELKQRVLPEVLAGRRIAALAITEPSGGSDVAALRTSAADLGAEVFLMDVARSGQGNAGMHDPQRLAVAFDTVLA